MRGLALPREHPPPAEGKNGGEQEPAGSCPCIRDRAKHPDPALPLPFQSPVGSPQLKSRDTALWSQAGKIKGKKRSLSVVHQEKPDLLWMEGNSGLRNHSEKICVQPAPVSSKNVY